MTPTVKSIAEQTIGKAAALNDKWHKENRGPTKEERAEFDLLLDTAEAQLGLDPIPRYGGAFLDWVERSDLSDIMFSPTAKVTVPTASSDNLFDSEGRAVRGLRASESFADVIATSAKGSRHETGQKLVDDGLTLGGYLRAMVTGPRTKAEQMALSGGTGGSGGYTVPEFLSAQLIDKFRPRMVCAQLGAQIVPLTGNNGSYVFTKLLTDPTPEWRHELTTIAKNEPTFGAITLTPRSLAVVVRCSRELLQDSLNIDRAIGDSLATAFALEVDRVGLFGTGAAAEPLGIVNEPGVNVESSVGTPASYDGILDSMKSIMIDNAPDPTGLVMSPREWRTYAGLVSGVDNQPLLKPPAIGNLPFVPTSACTDGTMIMGHFPELAFGIRADMQIDVLKELYAETHEYGFVAHLRMDTAIFRPESFCVLTDVTAT